MRAEGDWKGSLGGAGERQGTLLLSVKIWAVGRSCWLWSRLGSGKYRWCSDIARGMTIPASFILRSRNVFTFIGLQRVYMSPTSSNWVGNCSPICFSCNVSNMWWYDTLKLHCLLLEQSFLTIYLVCNVCKRLHLQQLWWEKPLLTVFPVILNMVMVFTHIRNQPSWYTTFPNDKWGGFNILEHNSERKLFHGNMKCCSNLGGSLEFWHFFLLKL